ncbi:MAG: hypothetical protein WBV82_18810 [Myxococcaceae bacterium]
MGEWVAKAASEEFRAALREFAEPVMRPLLSGADRSVVEQLYCFAAAVWNAVVLLDVLGNPTAMTEILRRLHTLDDNAFVECFQLLDELCGLKELHYRDCTWVYRNVHVVRTASELQVKAEALSLADWMDTKEPLRVGLPG